MTLTITFTPGNPVYSKRCGGVSGFDGIVVCSRGNGYQVLDPKTGKTYQRETYDLIPLKWQDNRRVALKREVIREHL